MQTQVDMQQADKILAVIIRDGQIRTDDRSTLRALDVSPRRLPVYIHTIRSEMGVPLTALRSGRKVVAYALVPPTEDLTPAAGLTLH